MPYVSSLEPLSLRTGMCFTDVACHIKKQRRVKTRRAPASALTAVYTSRSPEQAGSCKGRRANSPSGI